MLWEVILKLCLLGEKWLAQEERRRRCPAVLQKEGALTVNTGAPATLDTTCSPQEASPDVRVDAA